MEVNIISPHNWISVVRDELANWLTLNKGRRPRSSEQSWSHLQMIPAAAPLAHNGLDATKNVYKVPSIASKFFDHFEPSSFRSLSQNIVIENEPIWSECRTLWQYRRLFEHSRGDSGEPPHCAPPAFVLRNRSPEL